jgi:hypothetical protein
VTLHTYQTINHGVVRADDRLRCGDCHDDVEFEGGPPRVDLVEELGFGLKAPMETVCVQCHGWESPDGFKETHEKHVREERFDCSTCHDFSRPDRGLDFPFPVSDEVELRLSPMTAGTLVSWSGAVRAIGYDVVRGSLDDLLSGGGDFSFATGSCLADDTTFLSIPDHDEPAAGDAFWYLSRPVFADGAGSYDSDGTGQHASRDAGIGASLATCP